MTALPPWANGPFELLVHAEGHLRKGDDIDRRMALISFDDALETSISTYLTLKPLQRGNREYASAKVEKWLRNYHKKLDFLDAELTKRRLTWLVERGHIVWAHDQRNEQYHGGRKGTPEKKDLALIRTAAIWVFSVLFDIPDAGRLLDEGIAALTPPAAPISDTDCDQAIDQEFGIVEIGDQRYHASELLFGADPAAYFEVGKRLKERDEATKPEEGSR